MKKILIISLMITILFSGCSNSDHETELLEARIESAEEKVLSLEKQIADSERYINHLTEELAHAETRAAESEFELFNMIDAGFTNPVVHNQNIVVKSPKKNRVTFEIDERLVGKYVVEDDPEMYFEIKSNGKAEISLNANTGYAKYSAECIQITAYYADAYNNDSIYEDYFSVYINFNLVTGNYTFGSYGLSVGFNGNSSFDSFISTTYWPELKMEFIKQT